MTDVFVSRHEGDKEAAYRSLGFGVSRVAIVKAIALNGFLHGA